MKKIVWSLGFFSIVLFAIPYEVTNVACDEKLSVRKSATLKSFAFTELSCDKKDIELIKYNASEKKYTWCKIRYRLYENIVTGWVYSKYIQKTPQKYTYVYGTKLDRLLKLAKGYYYGTNKVGKDYEKAYKAFLKASTQKSIVAYRYLGTMYLFGYGVNVNKEEAKKWLMKAIDLNDDNAKRIYAKYFLHL